MQYIKSVATAVALVLCLAHPASAQMKSFDSGIFTNWWGGVATDAARGGNGGTAAWWGGRGFGGGPIPWAPDIREVATADQPNFDQPITVPNIQTVCNDGRPLCSNPSLLAWARENNKLGVEIWNARNPAERHAFHNAGENHGFWPTEQCQKNYVECLVRRLQTINGHMRAWAEANPPDVKPFTPMSAGPVLITMVRSILTTEITQVCGMKLPGCQDLVDKAKAFDDALVDASNTLRQADKNCLARIYRDSSDPLAICNLEQNEAARTFLIGLDLANSRN